MRLYEYGGCRASFKMKVVPVHLRLGLPQTACIVANVLNLTARRARWTRSLHAAVPGHSSNGATGGKPVITDDTVPEGHAGLHSYLYGSGDDEQHKAAQGDGNYPFKRGEDDGTSLLNVDSYIQSRQGITSIVGVFAVYDAAQNLQYVSYGRNIVRNLKALRAKLPEDRVVYVRVMVFANRAMQTRSALEREAANWLEAAGTLPPGNGAEAEMWDGSAKDGNAVMSDQERASYLDKKDKLQKAMGKNDASGNSESQNNENVDWSAAIESDHQPEPPPPVTTTPFANASVHRSVANADVRQMPELAMNIDTVDDALEEVRPYLIADGGNVEVVAVDSSTGVVTLELQGACGSCPASSSTMKMGIERSLRAAFPTQLKEVVAVGNDGLKDGKNEITPQAVDLHLNLLRGAVAAYGGSVTVVSIENDDTLLVLKYSGPKPIGYGIIAAVKEKFPTLQQVIMLDAESGEPIEF
jgi:Fe-S cluster biogenesis protein NfuA